PRRYIGAEVTEDGRFLVITAANATSGNELYIKDLSTSDNRIVTIVDNMQQNHGVLTSTGDHLIIYTNLDAPNGRIVSAPISAPQPSNWIDLVPETENVLSPATGGGKIFAHYLKDATSQVQQYDLKGQLERTIELPGVGSASGFSAKAGDSTLYYSFTSYVYPPTIFKYDINTG